MPVNFTLTDEAKHLRDMLGEFAGKNVRYGIWANFLKDLADDLKDALSEATPVMSGDAAGNWYTRNVGKGAWEIYNTAKNVRNGYFYAIPLEHGSVLGERPWYNGGPRTVIRDGRVWSSQAVGGIVANTRLESIVDSAASVFLKELFSD